jgi:hypothetical protein
MPLTPSEIQDIIDYEIIVDCYDEAECRIGWANYLIDHINYPFEAEYLAVQTTGAKTWEKVVVVAAKTTEDDFNKYAFYVNIACQGLVIVANLNELRNIEADEETMNTLQIWRSEYADL